MNSPNVPDDDVWCAACDGKGTITPVALALPVRVCDRCQGTKIEPTTVEPIHAWDRTRSTLRCGRDRGAAQAARGGPAWRWVSPGPISRADGVTCRRCLAQPSHRGDLMPDPMTDPSAYEDMVRKDMEAERRPGPLTLEDIDVIQRVGRDAKNNVTTLGLPELDALCSEARAGVLARAYIKRELEHETLDSNLVRDARENGLTAKQAARTLRVLLHELRIEPSPTSNNPDLLETVFEAVTHAVLSCLAPGSIKHPGRKALMPLDEAKKLVQEWNKRYPEVAKTHEDIAAAALKADAKMRRENPLNINIKNDE